MYSEIGSDLFRLLSLQVFDDMQGAKRAFFFTFILRLVRARMRDFITYNLIIGNNIVY